jgi:serine/threonine protein kinase
MVEETTEPTDSALLDSYVLGFLFYEILLGKDLFDREFEHVISHGRFGWLTWHADKAKRAKPLSAVISGFPSVLSSLIDGMMAKEASERITNLHKIADAIGGASQTTMMMSNLSSWQDGSEAGAPLRLSVTQKVDAFWRMLVSTAAAFCDRYRRGASPRKHK